MAPVMLVRQLQALCSRSRPMDSLVARLTSTAVGMECVTTNALTVNHDVAPSAANDCVAPPASANCVPNGISATLDTIGQPPQQLLVSGVALRPPHSSGVRTSRHTACRQPSCLAPPLLDLAPRSLHLKRLVPTSPSTRSPCSALRPPLSNAPRLRLLRGGGRRMPTLEQGDHGARAKQQCRPQPRALLPARTSRQISRHLSRTATQRTHEYWALAVTTRTMNSIQPRTSLSQPARPCGHKHVPRRQRRATAARARDSRHGTSSEGRCRQSSSRSDACNP